MRIDYALVGSILRDLIHICNYRTWEDIPSFFHFSFPFIDSIHLNINALKSILSLYRNITDGSQL